MLDKENADDIISIEDGIEAEERNECEFDFGVVNNFQNPSCFFNSFILKE